MLIGIIWALSAGIMLGLYALPEKFTKEFEFENTWGMFFFLGTFIVPNIVAIALIDGFGQILVAIPGNVLWGMGLASALWGIGVVMWGKAIDYIGLSLGFSLFIGTIILVGSLLPFLVSGIPEANTLLAIIVGLVVVLLGVVFNGKAGLARAADSQRSDGAMGKGILIAVVGGLLATGFSFANALGRDIIHQISLQQGNAEWATSLIVMYIIYTAGGVVIAAYFIWQLSAKGLWPRFKTKHIRQNVALTSTMAVFNFSASVAFAYAAYRLGAQGNTVGYAIFNTTSVAVAIVSGIITNEWASAPKTAKKFLYLGLGLMITGVAILAYGNSLS